MTPFRLLIGRCWALFWLAENPLKEKLHSNIVVCDINEDSSILNMVSQCKLLINCTGPYRLLGERVLSTCVKRIVCFLDLFYTVRPQHLHLSVKFRSDSVWYGLNQSTVKYLLFESWFSGALFPNKITGGYQYKLYIRLLCNDFLFDPHSKFSNTSVSPSSKLAKFAVSKKKILVNSNTIILNWIKVILAISKVDQSGLVDHLESGSNWFSHKSRVMLCAIHLRFRSGSKCFIKK